VARSPNGERAHWRGARAAPRARSLRRRSVARSRRCGAREGAEEKRMRLGFARGRRARFCSAGNLTQPSDLDGWLTLTGPSFSPVGMRLSRPRPRLRPGARDAPSASGPVDRFSSRATWRPDTRSASEEEWVAGHFSASGRFAARRAESFQRVRAVGRFHLRAEFRSEQYFSQFIYCQKLFKFEFNSLIKFEPMG
jgi:hypothetical protein